jgi:phospholipid/cholesterol/gamma-HCH transport system ATP-binding protein
MAQPANGAQSSRHSLSQQPALRARGIAKAFASQRIFSGLDLDVRSGEVLGLVGASGTGKSVLLRCLTGLESISAGTIEIFGRDTAGLSARERRDLDARWGVLFQDGALFGALTVAQNIAVPMREHLVIEPATMHELVMLKLAMVGLAPEAADKHPAELSGGMRKRAGLARALALDPKIVFLDEPTSGLDPIGAAAFDDLIANLQRTLGFTVIMVTHDLDSIFAICDRVAVLADHRIVRTGTPEALAVDPDHPWIAAYFGGTRARARIGRVPAAVDGRQPALGV